jgi:hypothetical protein
MLGVKGVAKHFSLGWSRPLVKEVSKCSLFGFNHLLEKLPSQTLSSFGTPECLYNGIRIKTLLNLKFVMKCKSQLLRKK